jgi:hypothetical protein
MEPLLRSREKVLRSAQDDGLFNFPNRFGIRARAGKGKQLFSGDGELLSKTA